MSDFLKKNANVDPMAELFTKNVYRTKKDKIETISSHNKNSLMNKYNQDEEESGYQTV